MGGNGGKPGGCPLFVTYRFVLEGTAGSLLFVTFSPRF
jgi:hypothetical protein